MSRLLPLVVVVISLGCAGAPGEITSAFPEILSANGKIVVFMRPPLDVVFERLDGDDVQTLTHAAIGSGSSRDDVALLVDVGEVSAGEVITVAARCDACNEVREIAFVDDDTTAPLIGDGPAALTAIGLRNSPIDPLIAFYEVDPSMEDVTDESTVFIRYRGDEIDVLRHVDNNFLIDGGIERTLCVNITVMDVAGNETALPEEECVHLDPSTASGLGRLPQPPG